MHCSCPYASRTIAFLHSRPLADSTPILKSPPDYFSDTLLGPTKTYSGLFCR
jgi:hypothetical protein